eukprot:66673-Rhodomonas_salina.7
MQIAELTQSWLTRATTRPHRSPRTCLEPPRARSGPGIAVHAHGQAAIGYERVAVASHTHRLGYLGQSSHNLCGHRPATTRRWVRTGRSCQALAQMPSTRGKFLPRLALQTRRRVRFHPVSAEHRMRGTEANTGHDSHGVHTVSCVSVQRPDTDTARVNAGHCIANAVHDSRSTCLIERAVVVH